MPPKRRPCACRGCQGVPRWVCPARPRPPTRRELLEVLVAVVETEPIAVAVPLLLAVLVELERHDQDAILEAVVDVYRAAGASDRAA